MEYERPLDALLPSYPIIRRISEQAGVALELEAPSSELGAKSAVVTAGPGGAFVPGEFALYVDPALNRTQWLVNPFEIIRSVLGKGLVPIPDTTTVSGRRLYFSHVDGDGWNDNVDNDPASPAAEVLLRDLIEPYPGLPVTVGPIASDLDTDLGGGEKAQDIARRIFALPQVEIASHTNTAPLNWEFYEHYDRAAEERLMQGGPSPQKDGVLSTIGYAFGLIRPRSEKDDMRSQYLSGARDLPRAFLRDAFSIDSEVDRAVSEMNSYAPKGKSARIYQWTGDARPFEQAIAATRRAGLRNINGGGSRLDGDYPSVGYVVPISRVVGSQRQIYAIDANENTFTNEWTRNFGGLSSLRETIENTESPRRLKGVGLYYHAYSAKKQASVGAVRSILDWAKGASLVPITAADYASIADGFFSTRIDQTAPLTWRVSNRDGLNTVRFDDAAGFEVDVSESQGVLGGTMHEGSLYLALDGAVEDAIVSLRRKQEAGGLAVGTQGAMLHSARWFVRGLHRDRCEYTFTASGYGSSQFEWRNLEPGKYVAEARRGSDVVWKDKPGNWK